MMTAGPAIGIDSLSTKKMPVPIGGADPEHHELEGAQVAFELLARVMLVLEDDGLAPKQLLPESGHIRLQRVVPAPL